MLRKNFNSFYNKITDEVDFKIKSVNTFVNPATYLSWRKSKVNIEAFDNIYIDGFILCAIFKLFLGLDVKRKSFDYTSLSSELFEYCALNGKSLYFVGTKDKVIDHAIENIASRYPGIKILGYHHGYIYTHDVGYDPVVVNDIISLKPDYVVIGMGAVNQELFAEYLKDHNIESSIYTCGGFLHQVSNIEKDSNYYPYYVNKLNLRWLYRIFKEPYLVKRYFILYPLSLCLLMSDFLTTRFSRK